MTAQAQRTTGAVLFVASMLGVRGVQQTALRYTSRAQPAVRPEAFSFEVVHQSTKSRARVGLIKTLHGVIETPAFVPVGTNGALKGVTSAQADACGVQLMFSNTYHLLVHPGPEVVAQAGGLHAFIGRDRPIITDSGGFQLFSLGQIERDTQGVQVAEGGELKSRSRYSRQDQACVSKVTEEGAVFRSYRDGSPLLLTPESSVRAQKDFGADIIIPLDELPSNDVSAAKLRESFARSHRWMARSLAEHERDRRTQAMYGVLHGGTDRALRAESAAFLGARGFDGTAIGGSLGADRAEMLGLLADLAPHLPEGRPVHLLGIADDKSVVAAAPHGIDTFDSCWPTRVARHGTLLTRAGRFNVRATEFKNDFRPIDLDVPELAEATGGTTRAYLHHLYKQREPLYVMLASMHNIAFMNYQMAQLREAILANEI
jgi:queuine tRNA-ribosyltransferase